MCACTSIKPALPVGSGRSNVASRKSEQSACVSRQNQTAFRIGDVRQQHRIQGRLDWPRGRAGAKQQPFGAHVADHVLHAAELRQPTRFEVQVRPALHRRQAVAQLRVVAAQQDDWRFEILRCRADRARITVTRDRHQQRTTAPQRPPDGAKSLGVHWPALHVRKEPQANCSTSQHTLQLAPATPGTALD